MGTRWQRLSNSALPLLQANKTAYYIRTFYSKKCVIRRTLDNLNLSLKRFKKRDQIKIICSWKI